MWVRSASKRRRLFVTASIVTACIVSVCSRVVILNSVVAPISFGGSSVHSVVFNRVSQHRLRRSSPRSSSLHFSSSNHGRSINCVYIYMFIQHLAGLIGSCNDLPKYFCRVVLQVSIGSKGYCKWRWLPNQGACAQQSCF